jgi:hypothetical protein
LGIGDWGLGIGDWAQSPIPNPHPHVFNFFILYTYNLKKYNKKKYNKNYCIKIKLND